jgi:hypothetical protein
VWDARSGEELLTFDKHEGLVSFAAFSPDGQRIVSGSGDRTAKIWEADTGRELLTLRGHGDWVGTVTFSADGERIITCSADQTIKLWDAAVGKELLTFKDHKDRVWSVAISPDGQRLASASVDETAKIRDAASKDQVARWLNEEREAAESLAARQRERRIAEERNRAQRLQDRGAIKQWLILSPISFTKGASGSPALQEEQLKRESQLRPRAGQRTMAGTNELTWRTVQLEDNLIDFSRVGGAMAEWSVAYAVCYIQSESAQSGLLLKISSDDQSKVYLNGRLIYRYRPRPNLRDQDFVEGIRLNAGANVVVFKVVNTTGDFLGSVHFTDADGHPLKGIRITLDPEAKD